MNSRSPFLPFLTCESEEVDKGSPLQHMLQQSQLICVTTAVRFGPRFQKHIGEQDTILLGISAKDPLRDFGQLTVATLVLEIETIWDQTQRVGSTTETLHMIFTRPPRRGQIMYILCLKNGDLSHTSLKPQTTYIFSSKWTKVLFILHA